MCLCIRWGYWLRESWGQVVVESMLTTCTPLVPVGHHFHNMLLDKESGDLCGPFAEWKEACGVCAGGVL